MFSKKLSESVGWEGPGMIFGWYFLSGLIIRAISPAFGKLTALEQRIEGEYRSKHTDLLNHSEEIAFYNGSDWEKKHINDKFKELLNHVKYGAFMVGYAIVGLPVFGPGREKYLEKVAADPSQITNDYVRNSSLLINLAKAIGRIVVSYKDV